MRLEWDRPVNEPPGSPRSFGRQLRAPLGGVCAGLDDRMIALLERLFEIPASAANKEPRTDSAAAHSLAKDSQFQSLGRNGAGQAADDRKAKKLKSLS